MTTYETFLKIKRLSLNLCFKIINKGRRKFHKIFMSSWNLEIKSVKIVNIFLKSALKSEMFFVKTKGNNSYMRKTKDESFDL